VESLAADAFQVVAARCHDQVRRLDAGEAIRSTGAAQQAIEERLFEFLVPLQTLLHQGAHQGHAAAGDPGLVPRRAENGAGHLAEPAAIAAGDFVVAFFDAHLSPAR